MLALVMVGCASQSTSTTTSTASTSASASDSKAEASTSTSAEDTTEASASTEDTTAAEDTTASDEAITLRTTYASGELFPEQIELYCADHENITIEQISADNTKLMSMIAAGTAPDMIRVMAVQDLPAYVTRGIIQPIDQYTSLGEYITDESDFVAAENNYRWDSTKAVQGEGELYGYVKDFSNDQALLINKQMFTDAGIEIPSETTPLTYTELGEICKKLQVMDGSTPKTYGMTFWDSDLMSIWRILVYNSQAGESPYSADYSTADFTNKATVDYMNWAIDLIKTGASVCSVVMQPPNGDYLGAFINGQCAIASTGYWYSGSVRSNELTKDNLDNYMYLPTPQIEGTDYVSYTTAATGGVMLRATKYPEETYKFMDFFFGGSPATDRAKSGWGLPMFKSMYDLLPSGTAFDDNAKAVALADTDAMTKVLPVNPYVAPATLTNLLAKYIPPVYTGDDTLDNALASINAEMQPLIAEGMEIAGVGTATTAE